MFFQLQNKRSKLDRMKYLKEWSIYVQNKCEIAFQSSVWWSSLGGEVNEGDRRFLLCIDSSGGSPFHFGGRGGVSKRVTEIVSTLSMIGWFVLRMDWLRLTICNSENPGVKWRVTAGKEDLHSKKGEVNKKRWWHKLCGKNESLDAVWFPF